MNPNIFLIVIDSFRADKCYGDSKTSITPNLDLLIHQGAYFNQTISSVGSTGSSMASIFTGLYPFRTGMSSNSYKKLNPNVKNFISFLKNEGYHTYAASPPLTSALGLTNNFESKDKNYQNYYSLFDGLGDDVLSKLKNKKLEKPWFFYFHINDLHKPIIVPKEFNEKKFGESQYEKMVSAIDTWIGKFLKEIDLKETLIIITADHGEYVPVITGDESLNFETSKKEQLLWKLGNKVPPSIRPAKVKIGNILRNIRSKQKEKKLNNLELTPYEKRILTNSRMEPGNHVYDDIVNVPLIFSGFNLSHKIISQQVRLIDIFPTIFDLLKLKTISNINGTSLLPLLEGKTMDELYSYIESSPTIKKSSEKIIGIRTEKYKYFRDINSKIFLELYDLKNDSLEENNIADENTDIVNNLEHILLDIINQPSDELVSDITNDEETKKIESELRKLGYM
jgi:arylsulfatase A-like enzyme